MNDTMNYKAQLDKALEELVDIIKTPRGAVSARVFNAEALQATRCVYCGEQDVDQRSVNKGSCRDCNATLNSLLNYKSQLLRGVLQTSSLPAMHALYSGMRILPPALRGKDGDASAVVKAVRKCTRLYYLSKVEELDDE